VTPGGTPGVYGVKLYVRAESPAAYYEGRDVWDAQTVPVYVKPAAPTIELLDGTGAVDTDHVTTLDNTSGKKLQFRVSNVVVGAEVTIYADGQQIAQGLAVNSTTNLFDSNGAVALNNGAHTITAVQKIANVAVNIGNLNTATDLVSPTSTALSITVDTVLPQITSAPVTSAAEGQPYRYDVDANKEADGGLTYSLVHAPAGMAIPNTQNGIILWTPTAGQAGAQQVTVRALDRTGNSTEQSFSINVIPSAHIQPIGAKQVNEGAPVTFKVEADVDSAHLPLTFSLASGAPAGAAIDRDTGVFTWTPSEAQGYGQYTVTVQVTTRTGAVATQAVEITVAEVNQAPAVAPIVDQAIDEGQLLDFLVGAKDYDVPANRLIFSLQNAPEGAVLDPNTGRFTWRANEEQGGREFTMTVRVTDSAGAFAERTFKVGVREVDEAPRFEPIELPFATPGTTVQLNVNAFDPDLPTKEIRYSLEPGAPEGASIDPLTGRLTWDVPESGSGVVVLGIRATEITSDGQPGLSAVQTLKVSVFDYRVAASATDNGSSGRQQKSKESGDAQHKSSEELDPEVLEAIAAAASPGGATIARRAASVAGLDDKAGEPVDNTRLFSSTLGPDTGSGGNPAPQAEANTEKKDNADEKPADSSDGKGQPAPQGNPQRNKAQPASDEKEPKRQPTRQQTSDDASDDTYDVIAEALDEEDLEMLALWQASQQSATQTEGAEAPQTSNEDAESVPTESVQVATTR
jgi:hypothetical protein